MAAVYAIIGDGSTRKSSTSRALTGVGQRKQVSVATVSGPLDIFVCIQSLQEAGISPQAFIAEVTNGGYQNALVTLWDSPGNGHPAGSTYLQDFANAGWSIQQIVVLGVSQLLHPLSNAMPQPNYVANATAIPVNQIASHARGWWGWL